MIYVAMGMWLFLILLTGMGVYRMWTKHLGGAVADWILLPATVMSEIAYSAGRLITGRPAYGGIISPRNPSNDACRTAISGKGGFPVAMLSSFLVLVVCGAALGLLSGWMGEGAIRAFVSPSGIFEWITANARPRSVDAATLRFERMPSQSARCLPEIYRPLDPDTLGIT